MASDELCNSLSAYHDMQLAFTSAVHEDALNKVLENAPNLVFLDVDRSGRIGNPFSFANELHQFLDELPKFIAISTSKRMAYDVIKNGFFDYLLKPFSDLEIRKCLKRYDKDMRCKTSEMLCLKSYSDYQFLDLKEIIFLKADNNTTDFFLTEGRTITAFKTLKYFQNKLPESFIRVHHSYIVNKSQVSRINFGKSEIFLKRYSASLPFSKSYRDKVLDIKKDFYQNPLSIVS